MDAEKAVNGWKQAVDIIEKQQRALEWCVTEIRRLGDEGHVEHDEQKAKEFYEVVQRAIGTGGAYIEAMRQSGALK